MHSKTPPSPMGNLSLHTSFSSSSFSSPPSYARSDCSTVSPLSSTTTSPASSPTSPFRRLCRPAPSSWGFNANTNAKTSTNNIDNIDNSLIHDHNTHSDADAECETRTHRTHHRRHRRPSSSLLSLSLFFRRRPSKVDRALSEERARCDEDAVERLGVGLLEPRPVDSAPAPVSAPVSDLVEGEGGLRLGSGREALGMGLGSRPRFVMGGIEEVLRGEA